MNLSDNTTYTYGGNATLQARDQFLSNKMMENSSRPDNLPPSQGGKYVGFGNTVQHQHSTSNNSDYVNTLSSWGQALACGATQLARYMVEHFHISYYDMLLSFTVIFSS